MRTHVFTAKTRGCSVRTHAFSGRIPVCSARTRVLLIPVILIVVRTQQAEVVGDSGAEATILDR